MTLPIYQATRVGRYRVAYSFSEGDFDILPTPPRPGLLRISQHSLPQFLSNPVQQTIVHGPGVPRFSNPLQQPQYPGNARMASLMGPETCSSCMGTPAVASPAVASLVRLTATNGVGNVQSPNTGQSAIASIASSLDSSGNTSPSTSGTTSGSSSGGNVAAPGTASGGATGGATSSLGGPTRAIAQ